MASQDARMEIVIAAQAQEFLRSMQATVAMGNEVSKALRSMGGEFKQIQGAAQPAEKAMATLGDKIRDYKREQSGQARTVNFFVRELVEVAGLSKEASNAVSGLGQVMIEAAAGGGMFAVGFEAVKFVVGQVAEAYKAATEAAENFGKVGQAATAGLLAARDSLDKILRGKESPGAQAYRETFDAGSKSAADLTEALEKARPSTWQQIAAFIWDGSQGMRHLNDEYEKAAGNLDRLVKGTKDYAEQARVATEGYELPPNANELFFKARADAAKKAIEAGKEYRKLLEHIAELEREHANTVNGYIRLLGPNATSPVAMGSGYLQWEAQQIGTYDRDAPFRSAEANVKTPVIDWKAFNPSGDKPIKDLEKSMRPIIGLANDLSQSFGSFFKSIMSGSKSVGEAFTSLFTSIADAFIDMMAKMVAAGFMELIGMIIGGPVGALFGALGSSLIPSFDVGTLSVPRTGFALVHQGEKITPAGQAAWEGNGGATTVNVTFNAPVDRGWWQANQTHIVDVIRDASRNRRL